MYDKRIRKALFSTKEKGSRALIIISIIKSRKVLIINLIIVVENIINYSIINLVNINSG